MLPAPQRFGMCRVATCPNAVRLDDVVGDLVVCVPMPTRATLTDGDGNEREVTKLWFTECDLEGIDEVKLIVQDRPVDPSFEKWQSSGRLTVWRPPQTTNLRLRHWQAGSRA